MLALWLTLPEAPELSGALARPAWECWPRGAPHKPNSGPSSFNTRSLLSSARFPRVPAGFGSSTDTGSGGEKAEAGAEATVSRCPPAGAEGSH